MKTFFGNPITVTVDLGDRVVDLTAALFLSDDGDMTLHTREALDIIRGSKPKCCCCNCRCQS